MRRESLLVTSPLEALAGAESIQSVASNGNVHGGQREDGEKEQAEAAAEAALDGATDGAVNGAVPNGLTRQANGGE